MTTNHDAEPTAEPPELRVRSDWPFYVGLSVIGGSYVLLLVAMLIAEATHTSANVVWESLQSPEVQYSIRLSLISCAITTILSVWVAVPIGYLMSRHTFPGKALVDSVLDIPIVLPPLVVGLCLLIFFRSPAVLFAESMLLDVEQFLADNLVPAASLIAAAVVATVIYRVLKRATPSVGLRALVSIAAVLIPFLAVSWNHLFPTMPGWVPVPDQFESVGVNYRDQSPIVTSQPVYTGTYRFHGDSAELVEAIESTYRSSGFANVRELGRGRALLKEGEGRFLAELSEAQQAETGFPGELLLTARPAAGETFQPGRAVDWLVTIDVQRTTSQSTPAFVPKLTFPVTLEIPAVILAQFMVACAFAVRTMRVTFDQIDSRFESVAMTLGCNRSQAFWRVVLPQCRTGILAAATLAWARSLGEFGPILIFAGSTRMKTEVLSTTVFLELTVGNIEGAVAASLIMVFSAIVVLVIARVSGLKRTSF